MEHGSARGKVMNTKEVITAALKAATARSKPVTPHVRRHQAEKEHTPESAEEIQAWEEHSDPERREVEENEEENEEEYEEEEEEEDDDVLDEYGCNPGALSATLRKESVFSVSNHQEFSDDADDAAPHQTYHRPQTHSRSASSSSYGTSYASFPPGSTHSDEDGGEDVERRRSSKGSADENPASYRGKGKANAGDLFDSDQDIEYASRTWIDVSDLDSDNAAANVQPRKSMKKTSKTGPSTGKTGQKVSACAAKQTLEQPITISSDSEHPDHGNEDVIHDIPTTSFPARTNIRKGEKGAVCLKQQHEDVQAVARGAIKMIELEIVMFEAYLDYIKKMQDYRAFLLAAAAEADKSTIHNRLLRDPGYYKEYSPLLDNRISLIRGAFKRSSAGQLSAQFGLRGSCADRVAHLIAKKHYICPRIMLAGGIEKVESNKPYQHPIFIEVLKRQCFNGPTSLGAQNIDQFISTVEGFTEPEIPPPMIALVATSIHSSLADWSTGVEVATEFCASKAVEVYKTHLGVLDELRMRKPKAYHRMASRLFTDASAGRQYASLEANTQDALEELDFEGMDED